MLEGKTVYDVLARAASLWRDWGIWDLGKEKNTKHRYRLRSKAAVDWVLEQAAHVRHVVFKGGVSSALMLSWTMEDEGCGVLCLKVYICV